MQSRFVAAVLIAAAAAAAFGADNAAKQADEFIAELRRGTKDPVKLAENILTAAGTLDGNAALQAALYERAYDIAVLSARGYGVAVEAMEGLVRIMPDKKAQWEANLLKVCRLQFARTRGAERTLIASKLLGLLVRQGDAHLRGGQAAKAAQLYSQALLAAKACGVTNTAEIIGKLQRANQARQMERLIQAQKDRLQGDPKDLAARMELLRLYLVELDQPARAAGLLDESVPETWRTYVPLAQKGLDETPEPLCLELGNWYWELAKKATAKGKEHAQTRAVSYYQRFLMLHQGEDASAAEVTKRLKLLGKMTWIDLLAMVDPAQHSVGRERWVKKGGIVGIDTPPRGCSQVLIPVKPIGSYELEVRFVNQGYVFVRLPVVDRPGGLVVVGTQGHSGIATVDGQRYHKNATTVKNWPFVAGRIYRLHVRVVLGDAKAVQVTATIDGKAFVSWKGKRSALSLSKSWDCSQPLALGLGTFQKPAQFLSARLRMLSGNAEIIKPTPPKKGPRKR